MHRAAKQLSLFVDDEKSAHSSGGSTDPSINNPLDFSVRKSNRAKRLSIKVYPRGRVEVIVPKRTRARDVEAFVSEHRDWIRKTRASFAKVHPPEPFELPRRIDLPAIERSFVVAYRPRRNLKKVRLHRRRETVVLSGSIDDEEQCVKALKRFLTSVAKEAFEPRLKSLSVLTGNPYKTMQVRGQKTCWGSHSSTGTISINYCLLFLEPALLRYLMIHELCHARHMNHSKRFWRLVGRFEPEYRRLDRELSDAWRQIPVWLGTN